MGSFDMTCAVSGFGISAGEPVRYGLLSGCPYTDQQVCTIKDLWFPRVWPVRAVYDDYGRPRDYTEGPSGVGAWLEAFHIDLVPRGWGNNTYHQPPTKKDWTFDQMQEAVWERRVRVRQDVDRFSTQAALRGEKGHPPISDLMPKQKIPKGVPTRQRVEKLLVAAGLELFEGPDKRNGLIVQNRGYGRVRVQLDGGFVDQRPLHLAEKRLRRRYATMLTKGPVNEGTSLLVRPKPNVDDYIYSDRPLKKEPSIPVMQYFIREDVWQGLTAQKVKGSWWSPKKKRSVDLDLTVATYRDAAQEVWDTLGRDRIEVWGLEHGDGTGWFAGDAVPYTVGLGTSFQIVHKAAREGKLGAKAVDAFLQEAAEFSFLQRVLIPTRFYWKPSYVCGPQCTEWDEHARYVDVLKKIADERLKEDMEERKKWE